MMLAFVLRVSIALFVVSTAFNITGFLWGITFRRVVSLSPVLVSALLFVPLSVASAVWVARRCRWPKRAVQTIGALWTASMIVPLFTGTLRPGDLLGVTVVAAYAVAFYIASRVVEKTIPPFPSGPAPAETRTFVGRAFPFLIAAVVCAYSFWWSFIGASVMWAAVSFAAYAFGRDAITDRYGSAFGLLKKALYPVDRLAIACLAGVAIRDSAIQTWQVEMRVNPVERPHYGRMSAYEAEGSPEYNPTMAFNTAKECAEIPDGYCQAVLATYYREGFGTERDDDAFAHWAWRSFWESRNPLGFNQFLVVVHETIPFSGLLNDLQSQESVDRAREVLGSE